MNFNLEEHKAEILGLTFTHNRAAVIDEATGDYQMLYLGGGAEAGHFRDYVIALAERAEQRERKDLIINLAIPRVTEALARQNGSYRHRYRLEGTPKGQYELVTFQRYGAGRLLAAFTTQDRSESDGELDLVRGDYARLRQRFQFLVKSLTDHFFEVNVRTRECLRINAVQGEVSWRPYEEQIQWFADHVLQQEEREAYLRTFQFDRLMQSILRNKGSFASNFNVAYPDGRHTLRTVSALVVDEMSGEEYIYSYSRDISEMRRQEEKNRQLLEISQKLLDISQNDGLTGLYNRAAAEKEIVEYLRNGREEPAGAMMIVDVDNFKRFNDSYGHAVGDEVLKHVAEAFRDAFRSGDLLCRWGGDEFLVFMKGIHDPNVIRSRLERLRLRAGKFVCNGNPVDVTLSIGVAITEGRSSLEELFQRADQALYEVKNSGKNGYRFSDGQSEAAQNGKEDT